MMEAADGGSIEAVTKQLELALLIDGALWILCYGLNAPHPNQDRDYDD